MIFKILVSKKWVIRTSNILYNFFEDFNECIMGTDNCHSEAICNNTIGTFTCYCKKGYSGNGTTCVGMSFNGIHLR